MKGDRSTGRSAEALVRAPRARTPAAASAGVATDDQQEMIAILRASPRDLGTKLAEEYRPLFQDVLDELLGQPSSAQPMLLTLSKSSPVVAGGVTSVTVTVQVTKSGNPVDNVLVRVRSSGTQVSPAEITTSGGSAEVTWTIAQLGDFALIAEAIDCGRVAAYDVVPIHVTGQQ